MFSLRDKTTPWADPRVRQAMSMMIDREAVLDIAYSLDKLAKDGFKLERKWNNFVPHAWGDYWLDPQGTEVSAESKSYFQYNPTAAKQLLTAAGFPDGFSANFFTVVRYGVAFDSVTEFLIQSWGKYWHQAQRRSSGLRLRVHHQDVSW